jgi:MFS family permease
LSRTLAVSVDHPAPYRYPLLLVGLVFVVDLFVTLATREGGSEQQQPTDSEGSVVTAHSPRAGAAPVAVIGLIGVVMALYSTGQWAATTFFNVYMDSALDAPALLIGGLAGAAQLVAGIATLSMPLLAKRWGKQRVIGWGSIGAALSLLPLALIPHWAAAGVGYIGAFALATTVNAAIFVYSQELVPPAWQAVMSGSVWMGMGIGGAAIVVGGGYLITALGYVSLFLTAAGVTAAGGLLCLAYFRVPRGELAKSRLLEQADRT